jgi:hypothetical protein
VITCSLLLTLICRTFHWPLGITITSHYDMFLCLPASFGSGNDVPTSFPIYNINKGRWTQDEHKIFMQEYEKYGNNCTQIARVLSTRTPAQIKKHHGGRDDLILSAKLIRIAPKTLFILAMVVMERTRIFRKIKCNSKFLRLS